MQSKTAPLCPAREAQPKTETWTRRGFSLGVYPFLDIKVVWWWWFVWVFGFFLGGGGGMGKA